MARPQSVSVVQYGHRDEDDDESEDESARHGFLGNVMMSKQKQQRNKERKGSGKGLAAFTTNLMNSSINRGSKRHLMEDNTGGGGDGTKNKDDKGGNDSDGSGDSVGSNVIKEKAKKTIKKIGKGLRFGRKKDDSSSGEDESDDDATDDEEDDMNRSDRSVSSIASQTLKRVTGKVTNVLGLGRRKDDDDYSDSDDDDDLLTNQQQRVQRRGRRQSQSQSQSDAARQISSTLFRRSQTTDAATPAARRALPLRASTGSEGPMLKKELRRCHTGEPRQRSQSPHRTSPRRNGSPRKQSPIRNRPVPKAAAIAYAATNVSDLSDNAAEGAVDRRTQTQKDIDEMDESDRRHRANFNPQAQYSSGQQQSRMGVPDWSMNVTEAMFEQAMSENEGDFKLNVPKQLLK